MKLATSSGVTAQGKALNDHARNKNPSAAPSRDYIECFNAVFRIIGEDGS